MRRLLFPPVAVASTLFFSALAVAGGWLRAPKGWYDGIHRSWSRTLFTLAGIEVRAEGLEHLRGGDAFIVAANHQSVLDIWALMAALPLSLRFVAKRELSRIPVFAGACRAAGHVFIDRRADAVAVGRIREAGARMRREGLALVLFPEGTRSRDGSLQRFRRGAFALAIETELPLLPVAIEGSGRVMPPGAWTPRPGRVRVRCGRPIPLADRGSEDREVVLRATRGAIAAMLDELRAAPEHAAS